MFNNSDDKIDFMKRLIKRGIKKNTAHKAFDRLNKKLGNIKSKKKIVKKKTKKRVVKRKKPEDEFKKVQQPHSGAMMQIWQLKEKGFQITEEYLIKNLYLSTGEIQWLKNQGEI